MLEEMWESLGEGMEKCVGGGGDEGKCWEGVGSVGK